jgi:hypothetical protein
MNKFFKILSAILIMFCDVSYAQQSLTISGYAPQLKDGTQIYLTPFYPRRYYKEQESESKAIKEKPIVVKNGQFTSTIIVRNGEMFNIKLANEASFKTICLAPGKLMMIIDGNNLNNVTFKNNITTAEFEKYWQYTYNNEYYVAFAKARNEWLAARSSPGPLLDLKNKQQDSLLRLWSKKTSGYVDEHLRRNPDSYINSYLLLYKSGSMPIEQVRTIFNSFPKNAINNKYGDNYGLV